MSAEDGIAPGIGVRRFGRVNRVGLATLAARETQRYLGIWTQTILAPLVTAALFLAVFTLAIGPARGPVMGVEFAQFLAPGILMMSVIQNAFANTSSSILVSKIQGNIVDTLMPPLSAGEMLAGYLAGALGRGLLVAVAIWAMEAVVLGVGLVHPLWALAFVLAGSALMGAVGVLAAIHATKFDHMAAITNFIIVPLSFLSGTFYSAAALPGAMQVATHLNPVFYLIDGVRYGVLGVSDASPVLGMAVCLGVTAAALALAWHWLRTGYRLKA